MEDGRSCCLGVGQSHRAEQHNVPCQVAGERGGGEGGRREGEGGRREGGGEEEVGRQVREGVPDVGETLTLEVWQS